MSNVAASGGTMDDVAPSVRDTIRSRLVGTRSRAGNRVHNVCRPHSRVRKPRAQLSLPRHLTAFARLFSSFLISLFGRSRLRTKLARSYIAGKLSQTTRRPFTNERSVSVRNWNDERELRALVFENWTQLCVLLNALVKGGKDRMFVYFVFSI